MESIIANRKIRALFGMILVFLFIIGCSNNDSDQLGGRTAEERDAVQIDTDLSRLSSTVLSAEVSNIYNSGRDNLGKTIRVRGTYSASFNTQLNMVIMYILTLDEDDCCREGFEIRVNRDLVFPDDYPKEGSFIEVDGVLRTHSDYGQTMMYLAVDEIFILK